ncbi:MAG: hypothetical protein QG629_718 [Patescibacteria group bacterium]|nr:glycosyltransferase family 39 protein [Candidatus Saccharibacteria bacterium]MDQ5963635.1 hypothetical protein [Patescibacteria group bacterium]
MKKHTLGALYTLHRSKIGWLLAALVVFYGLFLFRISSVVPEYASAEIETLHASSSLTAIWQNPVDAPYKLLVWLPYKWVSESALIPRIASGVFGMATICLFFLLLKQRYSKRQAVLGTAIFALSSLFLYASRFGAPYILQTCILIPFLLPLLWYSPRIPRNVITYIMIFVCVACLYVPGVLWLAIIAIIVYRKHLLIVTRSMQNKHLAISGLLAVALLAPLVWACIQNLDILKELLGFGTTLPAPQEYARELYSNLRALVYESSSHPELSLIGGPLLSAIDVVFAIFGAYHLWKKPRLASTYYVSGLLVLSLLLASLGGSVQLIMAAPLIYYFVAAGIYYLLNEWLRIFPKNPIAKKFAVCMIVLLVSISCLFHVRSYFVAWAHNDDTHAVFVEPQPAPNKN